MAGLFTNQKGKTNYGTLGTGPGHIITLADSNFGKTVATANNRPNNDANDAFIGYDQHVNAPTSVGISFGAPASLSNYIGNNGDGTNWLERLINIAALGNLVPQLHVHVIARRTSDAAWPRPVWGVMPPLAHDAEEVQNFISALRRKIWLG